jgi:hypothetical protein
LRGPIASQLPGGIDSEGHDAGFIGFCATVREQPLSAAALHRPVRWTKSPYHVAVGRNAILEMRSSGLPCSGTFASARRDNSYDQQSDGGHDDNHIYQHVTPAGAAWQVQG